MAQKTSNSSKKSTGGKTSSRSYTASSAKSSSGKTATVSSSSKSTATTRTASHNAKKSHELRSEAWEWVLFLVFILLAVGVILGGKMGIVGTYLQRFFVGCFGFSAYLIVISFVLLMLFHILAPDKKLGGKTAAYFFMTILLAMLLHLMNGRELSNKELFTQASAKTGGWVGGILANLLMKGLGYVGAMITVIGLALIMILLLVGISYKKFLARAGRKTAVRAQEQMTRISERVESSRERHEQEREVRHEEKRQQQEEQRRKELEARKPVRQPIKDGSVDIPIIDDDYYSEKKRRYLESRQAEQQKVVSGTQLEIKTNLTEAPAEVKNNLTEAVSAASDASMPSMFDQLQDRPVPERTSRKSKNEHVEPADIAVSQPEKEDAYQFPDIQLLTPSDANAFTGSKAELLQNARILEESLMSFGVEAHVTEVNRGPAVTRYELQPAQGVKVSRIVNLSDDIALNLAAPAIRIEAPIPGKSAVGIEVPNKETTTVHLRDVIESSVFRNAKSPLTFALGKSIDGEIKVADVARMPHLLIAGATGSGKSVCINSIIVSLLYKADPKDVRMILIDPKVVELSIYNGIPHLLLPVVNEAKKAAATLNWAVQEMTSRYKKFADMNVRDIIGYNEAVRELSEGEPENMPQIVIIIDELADLMMVASKEVEEAICRLAQLARAAGIHLIIATQRPSVDVITGLIKANIPSRLAFAVSSGIDSRTILDMVGAEKLLGRGDMLFAPIGASKPTRIQGCFVSDHEVEAVVKAVRNCAVPNDTPGLQESIQDMAVSNDMAVEEGEDSDLLEQAIKLTIDKQQASISALQRAFRIGFNRAARLMDAMEERGIVGPQQEGAKPRKALITREEFYDNADNDLD